MCSVVMLRASSPIRLLWIRSVDERVNGGGLEFGMTAAHPAVASIAVGFAQRPRIRPQRATDIDQRDFKRLSHPSPYHRLKCSGG